MDAKEFTAKWKKVDELDEGIAKALDAGLDEKSAALHMLIAEYVNTRSAVASPASVFSEKPVFGENFYFDQYHR
jgi:hypothetical protein